MRGFLLLALILALATIIYLGVQLAEAERHIYKLQSDIVILDREIQNG